jgi:protein KTI12
MPLIIICGIPCSGKTKRANELKRIMETYAPSEKDNNEAGKSSKKSSVESTEEPPKQQKKEVKLLKEKRVVHLLNDDSFGLDRIKTYSTIAEEKKARSMLMSSVERLLNKDTVVIADAMNYIKGFRYQLYCVAKSLRTPHCIVHAAVPIQKAREWHNNRKKEEKYDPDMFENLITRFEEPDSRNRWDSPLFTLLPEDNIEDFAQNIVDALILRKAPPPNLSTVSVRINKGKNKYYYVIR